MLLSFLYQLQKLRRNQWLSPSQLEEIQGVKLRRMVRHAYDNVLYYRRLLDSVNVRPEEIRIAADLSRIPITTRKQIQQAPLEEVTAKGTNLKKCKNITTSGSSGLPLRVILNPADSAFHDMIWARAYLENGQKIGDKIASLKFAARPRR